SATSPRVIAVCALVAAVVAVWGFAFVNQPRSNPQAAALTAQSPSPTAPSPTATAQSSASPPPSPASLPPSNPGQAPPPPPAGTSPPSPVPDPSPSPQPSPSPSPTPTPSPSPAPKTGLSWSSNAVATGGKITARSPTFNSYSPFTVNWSYSCVVPPLTGGITFELDVNPSTQGSIVLVGPRGSDPQSSGTAHVNMGGSRLVQYSLTLRVSQTPPPF